MHTTANSDSVLNMRPLSMVEDDGFRALIIALYPGYTLPSKTHFTTLMERKSQETFQVVKINIKANINISLTTDGHV